MKIETRLICIIHAGSNSEVSWNLVVKTIIDLLMNVVTSEVTDVSKNVVVSVNARMNSRGNRSDSERSNFKYSECDKLRVESQKRRELCRFKSIKGIFLVSQSGSDSNIEFKFVKQNEMMHVLLLTWS